jgi:hypothetical protein
MTSPRPTDAVFECRECTRPHEIDDILVALGHICRAAHDASGISKKLSVARFDVLVSTVLIRDVNSRNPPWRRFKDNIISMREWNRRLYRHNSLEQAAIIANWNAWWTSNAGKSVTTVVADLLDTYSRDQSEALANDRPHALRFLGASDDNARLASIAADVLRYGPDVVSRLAAMSLA